MECCLNHFMFCRFVKLLPGLLLTVSLSVVVSNLWLNEADAFTLAITLGFIMLSVMMTFLEFHCSVDGERLELMFFFEEW